MARRVARVYRNADGTWTVRVGRQVQHVDHVGKSAGEIFEEVRWALISKGVFLENVDLIELMRKEK